MSLGAIIMLIFGIIVLYVFGLGWGIYRAWSKARRMQRSEAKQA